VIEIIGVGIEEEVEEGEGEVEVVLPPLRTFIRIVKTITRRVERILRRLSITLPIRNDPKSVLPSPPSSLYHNPSSDVIEYYSSVLIERSHCNVSTPPC
jgi:hypothetical protein